MRHSDGSLSGPEILVLHLMRVRLIIVMHKTEVDGNARPESRAGRGHSSLVDRWLRNVKNDPFFAGVILLATVSVVLHNSSAEFRS